MHPVVCHVWCSYCISQHNNSTYNKQINTIVLTFVYCVEVLLHVSTLLAHHHAIIT
jgi:hypothetical protein